MTTWIRSTCATDTIAIHYLRTGGGGPAVVLLHGLMGSGACWTPVARALAGEFDVIMPDARGHGRSSAPPDGYRYDDLANDVVALIRGLALSRPVLVGHSMGGMTAAVAAAAAPPGTLGGLVLVDPTFLSPARQREVHESDVIEQHRQALRLTPAELVAQGRARHPHRSHALLEWQAEARLHTSLAAFDVLRPPAPDYRALMRAIAVPTLLVVGDRSPVVTPDIAADLSALSPDLRVAQVEDAGHGLPFEQPERLAELIGSFLRRLRTVS